MQILNTVLNIVLFIGIIVVPMAALLYGSRALGWGFREYPKTTFAIIVLIFLSLIFAVLGFRYFFPGCRAEYGFRNMIYCESHQTH